MSDRDECVAGCPFTADVLQQSMPSHLPPMRLWDPTVVARFDYQRLQSWQTRMINLLPGKSEDPLSCELVVADLILASKAVGIAAWSRICTYEALSYSWGWPERDYEIRCGGKSIKIPPSLADALQHLRSATESRILWCDALCINQDDADEKASQVRNMFIIFKSATRVIGWLGKEDDHCMMFRYIASMHRWPTLEDLEAVRSICRPGSHNKDCGANMREDVAVFLGRGLFHRLWIRQEFAVADVLVLQCGSQTADFPSFVELMAPFLADPALGDLPSTLAVLRRDLDFIVSVQATRQQAKFGVELLHWLQVLSDGQKFGSSNSSDRVYALLSLADPDSPAFDSAIDLLRPTSNFNIDYREPVGRTYWRLTSHLLHLDNSNMEALWFFGPRYIDSIRLPSWVVDWRSQTPHLFPSLFARNSRKYRYVGQWLNWSLDQSSSSLRAEALPLAQVLRKEERIQRHELAAMVLNTPFFGDEVGGYLAEQAMAGTYCLYSAGQTFWESAPRPHKTWERWSPWKSHVLPTEITPENLPYLSFFAPATTVVTDRIAMIGPATFPCVLRPTGAGSQYQFIGACSVVLARGLWPDTIVHQDSPVNILSLADLARVFNWSRACEIDDHNDNCATYSAFLNVRGSRSFRADRPLYYDEWASEIELV